MGFDLKTFRLLVRKTLCKGPYFMVYIFVHTLRISQLVLINTNEIHHDIRLSDTLFYLK